MAMTYQPMLCGSVDVVPTGDDWALEPKLDGWRAGIFRENGVSVVARSGAFYKGKVPNIEAAVAASVADGTLLDGELIGPHGWGDVQSVMTSNGVPPNVELTYVVFDILFSESIDVRGLRWEERRGILEEIDFEDGVLLAPVGESTQAAHEELVKLGMEGSVAKWRKSPYVAGRSNRWVKIKPQQTCEARVTGFKPGEGEFKGMIGAIEFTLEENGVASRCSGMDMATRQDMTDRPEGWIGHVIEIKHHGLMGSGKPRHPQFLRRRDDVEWVPPPAKALAAASRPGRSQRPSRMRNYKAMKNEKLLECRASLLAGYGEAYDRCVNQGSGAPLHDLKVVQAECRARGLQP